MMSIQSAFLNGKAALRRGAFGVAMAATLFGANAAQASDFTREQCGSIFAVSSNVVGTLGADTLSPTLPMSLARFIAPSAPDPVHKVIIQGTFREIAGSKSEDAMALKAAIIPTLTCDGPKDIVTATGPDIDAFNTIRSFLLGAKTPISLQEAGLRSVEGPVASLQVQQAPQPQ